MTTTAYTPGARKRARRRRSCGELSRRQRAALDARLGKVRHTVLYRAHHTPVQAGELVRLTGHGAGDRRFRFVEFVELLDNPSRSYVTVIDSFERDRSMRYISARPAQVVRVRKQEAAR